MAAVEGWRRIASAAQWPLRTALSIVAGNPVSIQSPARNRPRGAAWSSPVVGPPGATEMWRADHE